MIRPYRDTDKALLSGWLTDASIAVEKQAHAEDETWVLEDDGQPVGFFTWRYEYCMPYLVHFIVRRESRCHRLARELVRGFKDALRRVGHRQTVVNVPERMGDVARLVEVYFGAKPYAHSDGHIFFLVEV